MPERQSWAQQDDFKLISTMWNAVLWLHKVAVLYIKPQLFTGQQFGSSANRSASAQARHSNRFWFKIVWILHAESRASIAKMSSSMLLLWTAVLAALFARGKKICLWLPCTLTYPEYMHDPNLVYNTLRTLVINWVAALQDAEGTPIYACMQTLPRVDLV